MNFDLKIEFNQNGKMFVKIDFRSNVITIQYLDTLDEFLVSDKRGKSWNLNEIALPCVFYHYDFTAEQKEVAIKAIEFMKNLSKDFYTQKP